MPSSKGRTPALAADQDDLPLDFGASDPRHSLSVERGFAVLTCFTAERLVLGVAEVADKTGLTRSTAHRYMTTLVALGYLEQYTNRKYRIGLRGHDLGLAAVNTLGLREHARGPMEELRRDTGFTTSLALLVGVEVLYVERFRSHRKGQCLVDMDLRVGARLPAYCTALGKLLLAYLPDEEQRDLVGKIKLLRRAPNSITSERAFRAELAQIKEKGAAVNDRELLPELRAVARPVYSGSDEVIAAVNLAAHIELVTLRSLVDTHGARLSVAADLISERLSSQPETTRGRKGFDGGRLR